MAQNGKKANPWKIVTVIASIILVGALAALAVIGFSYWQGQNEYAKLRNGAGLNVDDANGLAKMSADWDTLRAENPDVVGWVNMPNTPIDYPVVQGKDNEFYLNHSFSGEQNWLATYGTIFLDCTNNAQFKDESNVLYGHHMNDGSMFAEIDKMTNQEAFDKNSTYYILTPEGNYRLRTFAMVITDGSDAIVETNFANMAKKVAYIQDKLDRSVVSGTNLSAVELAKAKLFVMSTCDYSRGDGRAILFAYVAESTVPGVVGIEKTPLTDKAASIR